MEIMEFICDNCGESHKGIPPCIVLRSPTKLATIPKEQRAERCFLTEDLCVIDDEYFFVYGSLELQIRGIPDSFIWGVWTAIKEEDFFTYQDLLDVTGRELKHPIIGKMASDIPLYPPMLDLEVSVILQPVGLRPLFRLASSKHPLYAEQQMGISTNRVHEIISWYIHRPH
jgi:hypothetical protein